MARHIVGIQGKGIDNRLFWRSITNRSEASRMIEPVPTQDILVDSTRIGATMRQVGRRQWWLWSSAVMVTLLLALAIASFALPGLLTPTDASYSFNLNHALRTLVGLVLLFNVYTIYQQLQIHRVQSELIKQIAALDKLGARTEEVYKIALLDPLTGLYNRRAGEQRLAEEISRSQQHGLPLTLIMLDMNKLKHVNDTFGHASGDELIKYFAQRISKATRGSDVAIRLGGDEFLLLLPECKPDEVQYVLGRLSGMKMDLGGQTISPSFAAGWVDYAQGESLDELMARVDRALYANKGCGQDHQTEMRV